MSAKKRKYNEEYLQYGFTEAAENGQVVPQCVICFEKLRNDALRPNRLKRHLQTKHPLHQTKPLNFFQSKKDSFKKMKIICAENFGQSSSAEVVEASYEIAQMIAQAKKPHNIGESLIKPCTLKASSLVLGESNSKKLAKISPSDSTIKARIDELANDIKCQVLQQIQESPYFAIQCDETTDVAQFSQLMVYVRFVGAATIEEEMLFCKSLETTTKAENVFRLVDAYFHKNDMKWEKLFGVCTDGAPAMLGCRSGFITRVKQKNPGAVGTHCVIHREALASKTLPAAMKNKLAIVIRIVNFIKSSAVNSRLFSQRCKQMDSNHENLLFHTNVRWLSKGNMLALVYGLKDEVSIFLEFQGKQDLLLPFQSQEFQLTMAYLVDIFEALNCRNLLLQGKNTDRMKDYDELRTFIAKLGLWHRRVQRGNAASFPTLDIVLENSKAKLDGELKILYFPDLGKVELAEWKMTRNPFRIKEDILSEELQEEFLKMKCNSTAKDDFEAMSLNDYWAKYLRIYKNAGSVAIRTLFPFSSTYLCESGFSELVV